MIQMSYHEKYHFMFHRGHQSQQEIDYIFEGSAYQMVVISHQ